MLQNTLMIHPTVEIWIIINYFITKLSQNDHEHLLNKVSNKVSYQVTDKVLDELTDELTNVSS